MANPRSLLQQSKQIFLALAAVFSLLAAPGVMPLGGTALADANNLQQDVNALQGAGSTGVLAQVNDHGQVSTARAGVAELGTTQVVPLDARYRTGSVTKT